MASLSIMNSSVMKFRRQRLIDGPTMDRHRSVGTRVNIKWLAVKMGKVSSFQSLPAKNHLQASAISQSG
jgi:hypothetical protein